MLSCCHMDEPQISKFLWLKKKKNWKETQRQSQRERLIEADEVKHAENGRAFTMVQINQIGVDTLKKGEEEARNCGLRWGNKGAFMVGSSAQAPGGQARRG